LEDCQATQQKATELERGLKQIWPDAKEKLLRIKSEKKRTLTGVMQKRAQEERHLARDPLGSSNKE
jgi:hypothetical protein